MSAQITTPDQALQFILAGKATFTVKSEATGEHLTFQVRNWKKAKHGTLHFVSVRTGNDFASIGAVRDRNSFSLGNRADLPYDDKRVRGFRYVFEHLQNNRIPPKCEIWHEGTCGRCGRALTHPDSIASGIGPECASKMECV
jgi:hypothetical protein